MVQVPMMMLRERDALAFEDLVTVAFGLGNEGEKDRAWATRWIETASRGPAVTLTRMQWFEDLIGQPALQPWVAMAFMKRWGWWPEKHSVDSQRLRCDRCGAIVQTGSKLQLMGVDPIHVVHAGDCPE